MKHCRSHTVYIPGVSHPLRALVLQPHKPDFPGPAVLWIHGGGYCVGMPSMVWMSPASSLPERFGAVVVSPAYRLAPAHPWPAALDDCILALTWLAANAEELGARSDQVVVGGESAGGGLAAAVCQYMRDTNGVRVAFQTPLYPMLDDRPTPSSRNNTAPVWNTKKNLRAWSRYLRNVEGVPSAYAVPARATDYANLPPFYSFVCRAEPFLCETLAYAANLRLADVPAQVNIYDAPFHAFDMLRHRLPVSIEARDGFFRYFADAVTRYRAAQT